MVSRKSLLVASAAAATVSTLISAPTVRAASVYWDTNGTTPGASAGTTAAGTWNATNALWNSDPGGVGTGTVPWVSGDTAVIAAGTNATGTYTITMGAIESVGGITMEEGTTVTLGTISATVGVSAAAGGTTVDIQNAAGQMNMPGFKGTGAIVKTGPGTLALTTGDNSATGADNTGGITINQGVVLLSKNQGTGANTAPITLNGGTLKQNNGGTSISVGASKVFTIGANGGTFDSVGAGTWTLDSQLTGSGLITKIGANTLNITGFNPGTPFSGKYLVLAGDLNNGNVVGNYGSASGSDVITLNGGNLRSSNDQTIPAQYGITLGASGGGLNCVTLGTMTVNSVISGTSGGGLTKLGAQPAILGAANTFNGPTRSALGSLTVGNTLALQNSTLDMNGADLGTVSFSVASATLGGLSGSRNLTMPATSLSVGNNNANTTYSGQLSGAGSALTKIGTGTTTLTGANTYTGGTNVSAGKLVVNRLHESNAVAITAGTLQVADSSPTLPSFPSGQNSSVSRPGSMISISNDAGPLYSRVYNGTLDLGNNDLIVDYTGASPFADVQDMVRSGFNFGDWFGKGITSSTAANPLSNGNYALGVAENGTLTNPFGSDDPNDPNSLNPQFDNQIVDNTTVLVKFTHRVDLDLNGLVDGNDAAVFNGSFSEGDGGATWQTGDVDYDGVYSSNDAAIFNSFYDESLGHLPEPGALSLLGLAGLTLARRRNRKVS